MSNNFKTIKFEKELPIAWIILNRPHKYKQREVSAVQNLETLQRIAGYAHHIKGIRIKDLTVDIFFDEK